MGMSNKRRRIGPRYMGGVAEVGNRDKERRSE